MYNSPRQDDPDMSLDLFLNKFSLDTAVTLDIGVPMLPDEIRY